MAAALFIVACATTNVVEGQIKPTAGGKVDLELVSFDFETDESGARYVSGTVMNNTDKKWGIVRIMFALFDESGAQVGSTTDEIEGLLPGTPWKFRAPVAEETAKTAKVIELTGV
jgi:hypothetical protein